MDCVAVLSAFHGVVLGSFLLIVELGSRGHSVVAVDVPISNSGAAAAVEPLVFRTTNSPWVDKTSSYATAG